MLDLLNHWRSPRRPRSVENRWLAHSVVPFDRNMKRPQQIVQPEAIVTSRATIRDNEQSYMEELVHSDFRRVLMINRFAI